MENLGLYDDDQQPPLGQPDESQSSPDQSPPQPASKKGGKKDKALDLSKLDEKSVKIMVMLMVNLLQESMTTEQFFQEVIFKQNVKTKTKHFTMTFLKSADFFRVLKEKGIRSKDTEHPNLREFL